MDPVLWMDYAACRGMPSEVFFPPPDYMPSEALEVCGRCPVRSDCLDYADRHQLEDGVWGGLTGQARKKRRTSKAA